MSFGRLLAEAKAEVDATPASPIKLSEKRDTLRRFASRLRLSDTSLSMLLSDDVVFTKCDGTNIHGPSRCTSAIFESQRRLPSWDHEDDWHVDARRWTRTGHSGSDRVVITQTFLLSEDGRSIREIVESDR